MVAVPDDLIPYVIGFGIGSCGDGCTPACCRSGGSVITKGILQGPSLSTAFRKERLRSSRPVKLAGLGFKCDLRIGLCNGQVRPNECQGIIVIGFLQVSQPDGIGTGILSRLA